MRINSVLEISIQIKKKVKWIKNKIDSSTDLFNLMTQESACVLNKESLYTPIPAFEARVSKWPERLWATILNYKIFSTTIQQGTNRIIWVQCVSLRFMQKLGKCLWILWSIIVQMRINIFYKTGETGELWPLCFLCCVFGFLGNESAFEIRYCELRHTLIAIRSDLV